MTSQSKPAAEKKTKHSKAKRQKGDADQEKEEPKKKRKRRRKRRKRRREIEKKASKASIFRPWRRTGRFTTDRSCWWSFVGRWRNGPRVQMRRSVRWISTFSRAFLIYSHRFAMGSWLTSGLHHQDELFQLHRLQVERHSIQPIVADQQAQCSYDDGKCTDVTKCWFRRVTDQFVHRVEGAPEDLKTRI